MDERGATAGELVFTLLMYGVIAYFGYIYLIQ